VSLRARHLQEDGLFEYYLAEQGGEPVEPPAAEHLTDCAECRARYADLRRFMDALRTEADSELDEIFTPERQRAQQQHIARRVEHLGRHARVISFPGHLAGQPVPDASPRVAYHLMGWISAAAAAGLFVGIGLGTAYYSPAPASELQAVATRSVAASAAAPDPVATPALVPGLVSDVSEQFLSELELALERPHTPELDALDELTPHVRDVGFQLR
jgi:anti-sigma factor RsiW